MSERFAISLPGSDVFGAKLTDEVVDSLYPNPKVSTIASPPHAGIIFLNWSSSLIIPERTTKLLYSFPHNYENLPTVLASYKFDAGSGIFYGTLPFQYGALGLILMDTDAVNVNLKYFSLDIASTTIPAFLMQIRFYVMAERGYQA